MEHTPCTEEDQRDGKRCRTEGEVKGSWEERRKDEE